MTEANILCITASQGYKTFIISSKHTVLILQLLKSHLLSVYPMMQCYASYYGQSRENSRNLASEILLIYTPVLSTSNFRSADEQICWMDGSCRYNNLLHKEGTHAHTGMLQLFVLHIMMASPPLCLLLLLFERNAWTHCIHMYSHGLLLQRCINV